MLTNPLHDAGWLASLRSHPLPAYQLTGHLLTDAGHSLTMYWLDLLVQFGPRLGIPGLYTRYDVREFWRRHHALIDAYLDAIFPPGIRIDAMMSGYDEPPSTGWLLRTRRARVAVFAAASVVHRQNPEAFINARRFEFQQRLPPTLFLP